MKKLSFLLIGLMLLVLAAPTLAAKPEPKQIRHCGCVYDSLEGTSMIFHDLVLPGKSQGHRNHLASTDDYDLCFAGLDIDELPTYEMWVRDEADCMVSGTNTNLVICVDEAEFAPCGSEYVPLPE
jgi:hypothetical protein